MDVFVYSPRSRDKPLDNVPRHASWFARNHKQAQILFWELSTESPTNTRVDRVTANWTERELYRVGQKKQVGNYFINTLYQMILESKIQN